MRLAFTLALAVPMALAATAASAADTRLSCRGDVVADNASSTEDVQVTVEGGLEAPGAVTYAWARPDASVPMSLKALSGDTLQFHGITTKDGAVVVADAHLNRTTLALVLKVRRVGGAGPADLTLQTTCQRV